MSEHSVMSSIHTVKKMNIGFYRYTLLNRGGDRMVIEYANHLVSAGHDVTFYIKKIDTVFTINPKINIRLVPCLGTLSFLFYGALHKFVNDIIVVDIIHLPLFISWRNRVVYFAQADDVEYYNNILLRKLIDWFYRLYFLRGEPIITVSSRLSKTFYLRYGFDKISTVTNGIDIQKFYPDPDTYLQTLKEDRRAIVFMSRGDHYRKGFDLAMKVFDSLSETIAERIELWVCGSKLHEIKYRFPVRNFGVVDDANLRKILSSADIFFYPSRHEGFGLFPLEAMACGCVVVTTEAIPYAREAGFMLTSPINDVAKLTHDLMDLVLDANLLEQHKRMVGVVARKYDLKEGKVAFEAALRSAINRTI